MKTAGFLDRFSSHLKNVIARAISLAVSMNYSEVTPLHLLLALYRQSGSLAAEIMTKLEFDKSIILAELRKNSPGVKSANQIPELDSKSRTALEKAMLMAHDYEHTHIGTEHLLMGLITCADARVERVLKRNTVKKKQLIDNLKAVFSNTSKFPSIEDFSDMIGRMPHLNQMSVPDSDTQNPLTSLTPMPVTKNNKNDSFSLFTLELTDPAIQKNIDPVIGRDREIERIINILARRTKNNPILVGEPGVGKTAIVEGLAKKITRGDVPDLLKEKKIFALDMSLLISDTIYRGEFESRLKQIIEQVAKNKQYILFIDEIHNIIGTGSNQGAMDAANILKPALARGQLRCIGATTLGEYKKYISSDPALERRYQEVLIQETTPEQTVDIISGIKKYYENYHNTLITDQAVKAAVRLSHKYIHDNFLPDKAIDLIDEASAAVRVKQKKNNLEKQKQSLLNRLGQAKEQKKCSIAQEKFSTAKKWKSEEEKITKKINQLDEKKSKNNKKMKKRVQEKEIIQIIAQRLNIDPKILSKNEWEQLGTLEKRLNTKIIGQEEAITQIVYNLQQSHLNIKNPEKPFASLLFVGPSGTGKTETAKILAREYFHDKDALIKLDMSEFSESHGVSKLLGSPAGYVGYNERNLFLEKLSKKPHSVILLDDFDKAHAGIKKLLLQILDQAYLTDNMGKKINFKHAIIILTTNCGTELFKSAEIGFNRDGGNTKVKKQIIDSRLKQKFGHELISRLDKVIVFHSLSRKKVEKIIENKIALLACRLEKEQSFILETDKKAIQKLAAHAFDPDLGARRVENILQERLHRLLIDLMANNAQIKEKSPAKKKIMLSVKQNKLEMHKI